MDRQILLSLLNAYQPFDEEEKKMHLDAMSFVEAHPDCFERSLLEGHVTGSAWIVNPGKTHALLIHHYKLDKWFQPGGHCDGDGDVLRVAMKETFEETGLEAQPLSQEIFDIDNHTIPERKGIPAHIHYDIRFLLEAPLQEQELPGNEEVHAIRWIPLQDIHRYNHSESILRLVRKTEFALSCP